jgi:hypothetical protein
MIETAITIRGRACRLAVCVAMLATMAFAARPLGASFSVAYHGASHALDFEAACYIEYLQIAGSGNQSIVSNETVISLGPPSMEPGDARTVSCSEIPDGPNSVRKGRIRIRVSYHTLPLEPLRLSSS